MEEVNLINAIKDHAREIAQEIDDCECVQKDNVSAYTKEMAKQITYDHIIELIVGRGE